MSYYENESRFAGTTVTAPADLEKYDSELVTYTVFWNIQGLEREVSIPTPATYATFCTRLNKIVVPGLYGVLVLSIDGSGFQWLFREEDLSILAMHAEGAGAERILLLAHDNVSNRMLLVGLDVLTGQMTKFEVPEVPSGMVFIDPNNAVASVGEDLVWVKFLANGVVNFSVQEDEAQKGSVWGVYNGEIIFYSEDEAEAKGTLHFGKIIVQFDQTLKYVKTPNDCIWAVTRGGQVFRISSDGSMSLIETIDLTKVIGLGAFSKRLWIITRNGNVMMLGQEREDSRIALPLSIHTFVGE